MLKKINIFILRNTGLLLLFASLAIFLLHIAFYYEKKTFPSWLQFYVTTAGLGLLHAKIGSKFTLLNQLNQKMQHIEAIIVASNKTQVDNVKSIAHNEKDIETCRKLIKELKTKYDQLAKK